jgi:flagellar hook assembly protein FlgD
MVPTPIPAPFLVSVDIYNSAGEKVRNLYTGPSQNSMNQLQVIVGGPTATAPVSVDIAGLGIPGGDPTWNGSNQGGQFVSNGIYYVRVSYTDPFGNTTVVTDSVSVLGVQSQQAIEIFNSAGEVVRKFDLSGLTSTAQNLSVDLGPGQDAVAASTNPLTGAESGGVNLTLALANGGSQSLYWDGQSSNGDPLESGVYIIELVRTEPGQSATVKSVSITLLEAKNGTAQAMAASAWIGPNPVTQGTPILVHYAPNAQAWGQGNLFNLAGEMVAQASDGAGNGLIKFTRNVAPGIYLVDFEVRRNESVLARRVLKAAVVK